MLLHKETLSLIFRNLLAFGWRVICLWLVILIAPQTAGARQGGSETTDRPSALDRIEAEFKGDLPEIAERRVLRVLISYSRTNYFVDFGKEYGFDWLALAATGYEESKLDQSRSNPSGAIGIMQIKPSTAADKNVNVTPIDTIDNNIHAATKYLAFLRDRYFSDPAIPERARLDFTLAAYNAGPAKIVGLRREAAQKGYDPNLWFSNVETIAAARIGNETVTYVANINKFYMAYTDFYRHNLQRQLEKRSLESSPTN